MYEECEREWEEWGEGEWEQKGKGEWEEGGEGGWEEEGKVKGMGKEDGEKWDEDEMKEMGKNRKEKGKGVCSFLKKYFHLDPQDDREAEWSKRS